MHTCRMVVLAGIITLLHSVVMAVLFGIIVVTLMTMFGTIVIKLVFIVQIYSDLFSSFFMLAASCKYAILILK